MSDDTSSFLDPLGLSAPARRALRSAGIITKGDLGAWTKAALLELHGVGPSTIPKLAGLLADG